MRVAFDTTFQYRPPSGIGAYVSALLPHLAAIDPEFEIVPFSQPQSGFWTQVGPRVSRFGWEAGAAGLYARKQDIDLLHMPMMARPPMVGAPVVVTVHDVIPYVMPEYRATRAMQVSLGVAKRTLRFASAVIAPSQHAATDISRVLEVPEDKIWVTHEAADPGCRPISDTDRQDRSVQDRFGVTDRYIFNVGGLDARKNLPTLIRAFAELIRERSGDLSLVVAGAEHANNPVVFPPLRPLIAELGLESRVFLTGRVSEEDKLALMQCAEIYITPSLYEGFGLTVLDAMACGVPVIASNRTSLPEIVGDAGLLVEPRVSELTGALRTLLDDPALRNRYAEKGLARSREFSWDRTAAETVQVYRHVLGRKSRI